MKKRKVLTVILFVFVTMLMAQRMDFNTGWNISATAITPAKTNVTLPHAWNEEYAYRVNIAELPDDTVRYSKTFIADSDWVDQKVFIEFEGARQSAEVFLNGRRLGLHQNGVMAFGFDLTPFLRFGEENTIEVLTDNDWNYHEKRIVSHTGDSAVMEKVADGNNLPNNVLEPQSFQWNNKNFNANYGGLPKRVFLHVLPRLYQTLPLYSSLGTTGVYIYAKDFNISEHSATIHAESQVRNETGKAQDVVYAVEVIQKEDGLVIAMFQSPTYKIEAGETTTLSAEQRVKGLHFWSWGYGYLYDVVTRIVPVEYADNETLIFMCPEVTTTTGFRKTSFDHGQIRLNNRTIMMHGYAQRTSNEWPGVGMSVPEWLSDYSNRLMVESGGNLVRWMHVCPWKQDIESCDRVGLIEAMPAGDAEKDVTGRHWEQRTELMRDAIIFNRNNPSILFYECGNKGISEEHMREMKAIRDEYDPYGGRAIGAREMLSHESSAEYGGEMLYINKSATKPVWAMEYCRDEALRRYWDDWSYPYHKQGDGPLYRNADASAYNQNNDQFAIEMVRRWYDYWLVRPGTGDRISSGGAKIVFSDTNTHNRGESNYRTSGVVDAMRLPKDAFFVHQVMWNGWVTPDTSKTYIIGHWNYDKGTVKPVYVVSDAPKVKLFLNGKQVGKEKIDYHFLHTFDSIQYKQGTLRAVSYDEKGKELSRYTIATVGAPHHLNVKFIHPAGELIADGADMALVEFEVVDKKGNRCPLADNMVHFSVEGPIEWIGGIAHRDSVKYLEEWMSNSNCIRSLDLPVECGVGRALVRSAEYMEGHLVSPDFARIHYSVEGNLPISQGTLILPGMTPACLGSEYVSSYLGRGETPSTPSYTDLKHTVHPVRAVSGCNQDEAYRSIDDSEDTEWKNDGKASTAWIRYEFDSTVSINEISMKLTGWRQRSYPLEILAGDSLVWQGMTPQSLGYVHIPIDQPVEASTLTIRLKGAAKSEDAFGQITELVVPANGGELDLYKAKGGDKVRSELRIVECDFLSYRH